MAFTEFCARSGGSNLNAGTRTGNSTEPGTSADFTYAAGNFVNSTGVFTVASGNPSSDGVAVGDFASIYNPLNALECYGSAGSVSSDCASTPDSVALSITGDIDIRCQVSMEDWSPALAQTLVAKWTTTGNQRSWGLSVNTAGALQFGWSTNGTNNTFVSSTANLSANLPNQVMWVRVTFDVDNGAGGNTATFYTSTDGSSWSALGSAVVTAGTTSIFDNTTAVTVGNHLQGSTTALVGKVYKFELYNGIAGTRVANPDFTAQSAGATSFADGDGNTWTVNSPAAIVATTATNFVGRVTARDATTITVSTTAKAGPVPPDGTSVYTLKIGGAWKGPNATEMFPLDFVQNTLTNSAGDAPRINFKNAATYSVTAAMTHTNAGPMQFEGYTTSYGDGGRATIDGGTSGASYIVATFSGGLSTAVKNFVFQNNGATGNAALVNFPTTLGYLISGCVFSNSRGAGLLISGVGVVVECEAFACNASNTSSVAAFSCSAAGATFSYCIAHDNTGSNTAGFRMTQSGGLYNCISDSNGGNGFEGFGGTAGVAVTCMNCDAYNNGSDGFECLAGTEKSVMLLQNCNMVKNGGYGFTQTGAAIPMGNLINCGFGSGTQANTSGQTNNTKGMVVSGSITYEADVTPWVDPANGDFRIVWPAAMNAGRGSFTETQAGYSGTVGYPDVGAAQSRRGANRLAGWAGGLVS